MVALVNATALTISISEPEKAIFDKKIIVKDVIEITGQLVTFINTGSVLFNSTLTANKISWKDSVGITEKYNLGSNFRGLIG